VGLATDYINEPIMYTVQTGLY